MYALDAEYHEKCLPVLYNRCRDHKTQPRAKSYRCTRKSRALADVITCIEDVKQESETNPDMNSLFCRVLWLRHIWIIIHWLVLLRAYFSECFIILEVNILSLYYDNCLHRHVGNCVFENTRVTYIFWLHQNYILKQL